jgi:hypothetical protein
VISFIRQLFMCLMSVMTPLEFSCAEYSADHSALFRRIKRNLRYLKQWLINTRRVLRARETTVRGVYGDFLREYVFVNKTYGGTCSYHLKN